MQYFYYYWLFYVILLWSVGGYLHVWPAKVLGVFLMACALPIAPIATGGPPYELQKNVPYPLNSKKENLPLTNRTNPWQIDNF